MESRMPITPWGPSFSAEVARSLNLSLNNNNQNLVEEKTLTPEAWFQKKNDIYQDIIKRQNEERLNVIRGWHS